MSKILIPVCILQPYVHQNIFGIKFIFILQWPIYSATKQVQMVNSTTKIKVQMDSHMVAMDMQIQMANYKQLIIYLMAGDIEWSHQANLQKYFIINMTHLMKIKLMKVLMVALNMNIMDTMEWLQHGAIFISQKDAGEDDQFKVLVNQVDPVHQDTLVLQELGNQDQQEHLVRYRCQTNLYTIKKKKKFDKILIL